MCGQRLLIKMDLNERITSTFDFINRRTYNSAINETLIETDYVDYDLLESELVQQYFSKTMINNYYEEISSIKVNDPAKGLFYRYGRILEEQLPKEIKIQGKDFTFDYFYYQLKPKLTDDLLKLLQT